jgi:hypothetical protein
MHEVRPSFAEERVRSVQAQFRRVLSAWASDLLALRQEGLRQPTWVEPRSQDDGDSNRRVA